APQAAPDHTAERVALWRAIHVESDPPPHVLEDMIGLQLAAPEENWRQRPDMNPEATKRFRASILARARFAASRSGKLRSRRILARETGGERLRSRQAGDRRLDRRVDVSDARSERGDAASDRGPRDRLDLGDVLHVPDGI